MGRAGWTHPLYRVGQARVTLQKTSNNIQPPILFKVPKISGQKNSVEKLGLPRGLNYKIDDLLIEEEITSHWLLFAPY